MIYGMISGYLSDCILYNCVHYSDSCAIEDPDTNTLINTGGVFDNTRVAVFGEEGWRRDLEPLNIGRNDHACSSYTSGESRVR